MKKVLKRLLPYVIVNSVVYAIMGAIIGKNYAEIRNTRKRISADSRVLKRFIDESEVPADIRKKADPKDPEDPTMYD